MPGGLTSHDGLARNSQDFRRPDVRRRWTGSWREMWIWLWIVNPRVLPTEPLVVHSAGGSPDLSREGPFDVSQDYFFQCRGGGGQPPGSWIICRDASIARRRTRILR